MPRYFVKISIDELKDKIQKSKDAYLFKEKQSKWSRYNWRELLKNDLKVNFDFENYTESGFYGACSIAGYQTMPNGMSYLGISAGGDWEVPVFFIVYWDGKKIRGYVPSGGNPWNTDTKYAYGNSINADSKNIHKRWPEIEEDGRLDNGDVPEVDIIKVIRDIQERITEKVG